MKDTNSNITFGQYAADLYERWIATTWYAWLYGWAVLWMVSMDGGAVVVACMGPCTGTEQWNGENMSRLVEIPWQYSNEEVVDALVTASLAHNNPKWCSSFRCRQPLQIKERRSSMLDSRMLQPE
jgi:hypothetical protein